MRFVVPVSQSDKHLLPKKTALFKKLGGWKGHRLTFAPTPLTTADAAKAAEELKEVCPNVEVLAINRDPQGGWPKACNDHFQDVVNMLARVRNDSHWMWMELDCDPFRVGWQDALDTGYNAGGKPFCGHVRLTAEVTNPPLQGSHMIGAGIYPADFHVIAAAEYPYLHKKLPFDISLRWRVHQSGVTNTPLIAHQHSCKSVALNGKILSAEGFEDIDLESACVVHGVKDESLTDLILSGALDHLPPIIKSTPAPVGNSFIPAPAAPKVSLEAQLASAGYRVLMRGVWAHSTVQDEEIAAHLGGFQPPAPKTSMDQAIAALYRQPPPVPAQPISPVIQHDVQGDPEIGLLTSPHETLVSPTGETSPEQGADNAAPPVHIPSGGGEPQGETDEALLLAAPSSEPQTGQSLLTDLVVKVVAHRKPKRIAEWAEELHVDKEALKDLINSNPDKGLTIARAGWIQVAAA